MKVDLSNGERLIFKNHEELAKFLLFTSPRLVEEGVRVVGEVPRLFMGPTISVYIKINQRIRQNILSKACKEMMETQKPFDDKIPF